MNMAYVSKYVYAVSMQCRRLCSIFTVAQKGFTLIEIIVVLALVVISSSVVIFNYNGSRQAITLSATALDVANMVHIAQIGGRSSAQNLLNYDNTAELLLGSGKVRTGINFSVSNGVITAFTVYKGTDGVQGFNPSNGDSALEIKNIAIPGITMRLCTEGVPISPGVCPNPYTTNTAIEFSRLSSDPIIEANYLASLGGTGDSPVIQIESTSGSTTLYRYIVVEGTGNIFVR